MSDQEIREGFKKLGIDVTPVSKHYNPNDCGRKLMRTDNGSTGVSYSDHVCTDTDSSQLKVVYACINFRISGTNHECKRKKWSYTVWE